ncbi:MAG: hypothetical protein GY868_02355 [Deltaproteobacteria bacterium]|nr:hypothetical protein [Deltaproteobacteria bacterium]
MGAKGMSDKKLSGRRLKSVLVHLENPRPLLLENGIFDACGQRQLALLNIFMTDKSAQLTALSQTGKKILFV